MSEEEKEELEEEGEENGASTFKKTAIIVLLVLLAAMVYLFMHIRKMNRELEYFKTLNVYEQKEVGESQEVLGIESEKLSAVISEIMDTTGFIAQETQIKLSAEEETDTIEGYGFGYGSEMGSDDLDELYEDIRALLEEMEFTLVLEQVEDLKLPFVAFISYERDGVVCNIIRMDIEEKEASELEIGCFEETTNQ